jgi:hypothetical protein
MVWLEWLALSVAVAGAFVFSSWMFCFHGRSQTRALNHQAIGPSSNGLRALIAIRCYLRVDDDLTIHDIRCGAGACRSAVGRRT